MAAWFTLFVPSDLTFLSLTACLVTRDETKKHHTPYTVDSTMSTILEELDTV
jgi:hypothetical protein